MGPGDQTPDWTEPESNQANGTIRVGLRAESWGGTDRLYNITVTATDAEGHANHEIVQVIVPGESVLFADTFEDSPLDAPPNAPQVGRYSTATAWVTTAAPGGAKSAHLHPALGQGELRPRFTAPVPQDVRLHVETWLCHVAESVHFGLDTAADSQFAMITLQPDRSVTVFDGARHVDTGLRYAPNAWERYQVDYVVGSAQLVLTLNDQSVTTTVPVQNEVRGLWFACGLPGDDVQSRGFVDDVVADTPVTHGLLPTLTCVRTGNQLTLLWTGTGSTLQESDAVADPTGWKDLGTECPTTAHGINKRGRIVGMSHSDFPYKDVACLWENGTVGLVGTGRTPSGRNLTVAFGVNKGGRVVGQTDDPSDAAAIHVFSWDGHPSHVALDLPDVPGSVTSSAVAVNDLDQTVGADATIK